MARYSVSNIVQVWNDSTGERIEVGQDSDGLELVMVSFVSSDGKRSCELTMPIGQARLVCSALDAYIKSVTEGATLVEE